MFIIMVSKHGRCIIEQLFLVSVLLATPESLELYIRGIYRL
jgi:hypothetical protein